MKFERSYINWDEGVGLCCWEAPDKERLAELFRKVGTPFERMIEVEEYPAEALA
jgi:hypothetical protein